MRDCGLEHRFILNQIPRSKVKQFDDVHIVIGQRKSYLFQVHLWKHEVGVLKPS